MSDRCATSQPAGWLFHARVAAGGALLAAAVLSAASAAAQQERFLPVEQAFQVQAHWLAPGLAEVSVAIAPGYYVYREPLAFTAEGAGVGVPEVPAGVVRYDENFQKNVETYTGRLSVRLPVKAAGPFTLRVSTQGCAEAGLCYPVTVTPLRLDPAEALNATPPGLSSTVAKPAFPAMLWWGLGAVAVVAIGAASWRLRRGPGR